MDKTQKKKIFAHNEDCLSCRLISGFGVIGMGAYIYSQAKYRPLRWTRYALFAIACGITSIGITRLSGWRLNK